MNTLTTSNTLTSHSSGISDDEVPDDVIAPEIESEPRYNLQSQSQIQRMELDNDNEKSDEERSKESDEESSDEESSKESDAKSQKQN